MRTVLNSTTARILMAAVIVAACLWIYQPVMHGDWLWDDDTLLTANSDLLTTQGLWNIWFNPATPDYFPLTITALWVQWRVFGLDSTGYHLVAIALHAAGALLLWRLVALMKIPGAWLAGMLFAVHPVCVESVAWISEIKNTLSLVLFLLAACDFVRWEGGAGRAAYWRAWVFFLLAMLAKSSVVMFPVAALLFLWWRRGTVGWRDVGHLAPFFAVSFLLGLVTLYFQSARAIGAEEIPLGGAGSRIAIAGMALVFYLGKLLWPVRLLPIYPRWEVDPPTLWQFSPWLVIAAAAVVFWRYRKTWGRDAMMAFGFFFIMVLPVLGFVKIAFMRITWVSDHFVHLPMIGPVVLVAAMAAGAIQSLRGVSKTLLTASVAVVLCLLTMASRSYAAVWKNEDELWRHTLKSNWSAWQAHSRFGAREFARGNLQSALRHFTEGVRLRPDLAETHNNLASVLLRLGDAVGGVVHMRKALDNGPHLTGIRMNYTATLLNLGRTDEAISQYEVLRRDLPESPVVAYNLGILLRNAGRSAEARECFLEALRLKPDFQKSQIALESLDQKTGDSK